MMYQTYERPKRIGYGKDGEVFQIAEGLVAKIGNTGTMTRHEAEIAERLYEEGISVPFPYGVQLITFPEAANQDFCVCGEIKGFVMEKVVGKTGFQLRGLGLDLMAEAYDLVNKELERAKRKGFLPGDPKYPGNFIFTPEREIKLLDFTWWGHKDIPIF